MGAFTPNITDDFFDIIDCTLQLYGEKIKDNGEDAFLYSLGSRSVIVGAFDGCGGSGATRHLRLSGKTGAYLASRIVAGTVRDFFAQRDPADYSGCRDELKQCIHDTMRACHNVTGETSRLVSSVVRSFPTTAAFAVCSRDSKGEMIADCFWAGDSRLYFLDENGLHQLTVDDLSVADAMKNLYDDGVMTNVINLSKDFTLHHGTVTIDRKGILFGATDGCFGYVSTPMEFEYMLLDTLQKAHSPKEWEELLLSTIGAVSGDDHAMSGVVCGFGSFELLKSSFADRARELERRYISKVRKAEIEEKYALWEEYKPGYYSMCLGNAPAADAE